jgi:hypothetical protein
MSFLDRFSSFCRFCGTPELAKREPLKISLRFSQPTKICCNPNLQVRLSSFYISFESPTISNWNLKILYIRRRFDRAHKADAKTPNLIIGCSCLTLSCDLSLGSIEGQSWGLFHGVQTAESLMSCFCIRPLSRSASPIIRVNSHFLIGANNFAALCQQAQ